MNKSVLELSMLFGPVVQLVRTLACHARGRGFEPHPDRQIGTRFACSDFFVFLR